MSTLATEYLGLALRNPLVVGASSLNLNRDGVKRCADAGAGAVVLKSLFEEQIRLDSEALTQSLADAGAYHAEAFAYMEAEIGVRYGTREYLQIIRECKQEVAIPVIASINCVGSEWWLDFAGETAAAGADALELNIAIIPEDPAIPPAEIEDRYVEIVRTARNAVEVPVAVKLGPYFTSVPHLGVRLCEAGADGLVLFNRFYRPTIDIETMSLTVSDRFSSSAEASVALRWISLLSGRVDADLAAATGVHTAEDLVRMVLAGADCVQVVSALYQHQLGHIQVMLDGMTEWMERHGHDAIADCRGLMSQMANPHTELFGRCQYIKGVVGVE